MIVNEWIIGGAILLALSIILNIFLVMYIRREIVRVFVISETASEIFTRLDSFREHLNTVYETPTFYGDETLSGLLEHTKALYDYLYEYRELHSFTQPDLVEQLEAASLELQEKYDHQETQAEEKE